MAIFATHATAALIGALAVVLMTLCVGLANRREIRLRDLASSLVAMPPVYMLAALYALQPHNSKIWAPQAMSAWRQFPMHVFVTASGPNRAGPNGEQKLLRNIMLGCIILAAFLL